MCMTLCSDLVKPCLSAVCLTLSQLLMSKYLENDQPDQTVHQSLTSHEDRRQVKFATKRFQGLLCSEAFCVLKHF